MKVYLLLFVCFVTACAVATADESKLGKDDFVSSSVGAIFDKVGQYTSGEKKLLVNDEDDAPQGMDYEMDALGNKIPDKVVDAEEAKATGKPLFAKDSQQ